MRISSYFRNTHDALRNIQAHSTKSKRTEILSISGTALDPQGQNIGASGGVYVYGFWPVTIVPAGSRVPFEVTVEGTQSAADLNLLIEAQPIETALRQDFALENVSENQGESGYCVTGTIQNPGDALQEYAQIVVTLYNSQDSVINYGDSYFSPEEFNGQQAPSFEICIDTRSQDVARHDIQSFGE